MRSESLKKKWEKVQKTGLGNVVVGLAKKVFSQIPRIVFRFDHWHGKRPFETTNYKKLVVTLANTLPNLGTVVDVGCGLGDILARVRAQKKVGFDIDTQALKAARLIRSFSHPKIKFLPGSLSEFADSSIEKTDLLVVTNWLHGVSDDFLSENFRNIFEKKKIQYLIVDEFPHQKGRMESFFGYYGEVVAIEHDWQDDKRVILFLVRK